MVEENSRSEPSFYDSSSYFQAIVPSCSEHGRFNFRSSIDELAGNSRCVPSFHDASSEFLAEFHRACTIQLSSSIDKQDGNLRSEPRFHDSSSEFSAHSLSRVSPSVYVSTSVLHWRTSRKFTTMYYDNR